jgi:hypothetical protein
MNGNAQRTFKVLTIPDGKTYEFLFDGNPVKQVLD